MRHYSNTGLQKPAFQTAEPIESPDRLIFKSKENGNFENWEATFQIANNLRSKISFYELKHFFNGLQKLECYDIDPIWEKAKSHYFLIFVAWSLAQIICYSLVWNMGIKGVMMFVFIVLSTI